MDPAPPIVHDLTESQRVYCRARLLDWAELDACDRAEWMDVAVRDVFLLENKNHNWVGRPVDNVDFLTTEAVRLSSTYPAYIASGRASFPA